MSVAALWRVVAAAFTVAVLTAGVLLTWHLVRSDQYVHMGFTSDTFTKPISRLVFADFGGSDVIVTAGPAGEVQVRRELRWSSDDLRPKAVESWDADTLTITHNCGELHRDQCSLRYYISVPPEVKVEATTTAGDVVVNNMTGAVRIEVVSGDVHLDEDSGAVSVKSVSGDVTGSALKSSNVDLGGVSGDVKLTFAAAPQRVSVAKNSGDTTVWVPHGSGPYQVDVETTSGDRNVGVDSDSGAQRAITVKSTSGDVTVVYA